MDLHRTTFTLTTALLVLGNATSVAGPDAALMAARDRNPSLQAYSFHVEIAMRMRTFPWLRFHLDGDGHYVRGERYTIEFTQTPFFARSIKTIDLSPLDPTLWRKNFAVDVAGRNNATTTFILHPRKVDPGDENPLLSAHVTLDDKDSTRDVVLQYKSGDIEMNLNPGNMQGYRLPLSSDVTVKMSGQNLIAHADFTDYAIEHTMYARTAKASRSSRLSRASRNRPYPRAGSRS